MSNGSRDVVYIQKDDDLPYITFGSKLAWNVAKAWTVTHGDVDIIVRVDKQIAEDNITCIYRRDIGDMLEFIERVGIVEVEYKPTAFFHRSEDFKEWIK